MYVYQLILGVNNCSYEKRVVLVMRKDRIDWYFHWWSMKGPNRGGLFLENEDGPPNQRLSRVVRLTRFSFDQSSIPNTKNLGGKIRARRKFKSQRSITKTQISTRTQIATTNNQQKLKSQQDQETLISTTNR